MVKQRQARSSDFVGWLMLEFGGQIDPNAAPIWIASTASEILACRARFITALIRACELHLLSRRGR